MAGYDIVFLAGGWGAAFDFGVSEALADKVTEAAANDVVLGGICHGPLGLVHAKAPDGCPLVEGRRVTGRVETVLSRGRVVIDGRRFVGRAGHGVFLPRATCQYVH